MATIEVRAKIPLQESIVLATQRELEYPELEMQTANGRVWLSLVVPRDDAQRLWESGKHLGHYWVNTRVEALDVRLVVEDVSAEELMRLEGRHPQAAWYTSTEGQYQEAEELGERIATTIVDSCNRLLRWLRTKYGQFWVKPLRREEPVQNFLDQIQAKWRVPAGAWRRLNAYPPVIRVDRIVLGVADRYLQVRDWEKLQADLRRQDEPGAGLLLVATAKDRFTEGDRQMAIIHLNSALEWCVQTFVEGELKGVIPPESLKVVLRQAHGRLLNEWVLPLCRKRSIDVESVEWPSVKRVQDLRAEAGHLSRQGDLYALSESEFHTLAKNSISFICKLLGEATPKAPPPLSTATAAGTV